MVFVVMGVAGSGKTTVGRLLAARLGCAYVEGDDLHPAANVAKMASGVPLDDGDRAPWLDALAARIAAHVAAGEDAVVTCSALRRAYRDRLRRDTDGTQVRFVDLRGDRELLAERLAARAGHFFRVEMLDSQVAILEEPTSDERPIIVSIEPAPEAIVDAIIAASKRG